MNEKYKELMDSQAMSYAKIIKPVSANNVISVAEYEAYVAGFSACHDEMIKDLQALEQDKKNLKAIIAKELSENYEFGSEFVIKQKDKIEALDRKLSVAVKALNYYPDNCDACNFSGVDEAEFSARGCPSCDCLVARQALAEIKGE